MITFASSNKKKNNMDEKSKIGVKLNGSYTTDPKKMVSPVEGNPKKNCYDKEIKLDKR